MYAYLTGTVLMIDGITLTLQIDWMGLGLDIFAAPGLIAHAQRGNNLTLWIHHHKTEVSESLFWFETIEERALFRELNKVNGVWGKTALSLLGLGQEELMKAIQFEDDKILSSVPGIGKKTAQKIIVDLKWSINFEKKKSEKNESKTPASTTMNVMSSLVQMGYDKLRVESVIKTLDSSLGIEETVREVIRKLK